MRSNVKQDRMGKNAGNGFLTSADTGVRHSRVYCIPKHRHYTESTKHLATSYAKHPKLRKAVWIPSKVYTCTFLVVKQSIVVVGREGEVRVVDDADDGCKAERESERGKGVVLLQIKCEERLPPVKASF